MPSGARKRKAAKKKKGQKGDNNNSNNSSSVDIHSNNNSNSSQGNDDQRSQDGRDSDSSEVGSPVSHENEGSANRDLEVTNENKQMEGTATDADGLGGDDVGKVDTDLKSGLNAQSEDVIVEHIGSSKELHGDDTSSSSSSSSGSNSSSDDESQSLEMTQEDVKETDSFSKELPEISENVTQIEGTGYGSDGEADTHVDMAVPALPLPTDLVNPEVVEVVEMGIKENEDKLLSLTNDISQIGVVSQETEDKGSPALVEDHVPVSSDLVSGEDVNEGKILTSSGASTTETIDVEEIVKASGTSNGTTIGDEGKTMNLSGVHTDGTSNGSETVKAAVATNETGNGNVEKYSAPGAHPSETVHVAEHAKNSESQPLVSSAPRVAQRTSWLSCCGLFDAFTGSSS